jgi:2-dehydropantoate 2-reductase
MKFAVIGVGGVGGYFGGRLAAGGHDVWFVARGDNLAALRRDGLTVESIAGDFAVAPAQATADAGQIGEVDFVLLCTKTWQVPAAVAQLRPMIGAGTGVVTLQNGVDIPESVAAAVGRDAVLPGAARIFSNLESPGRVSHVGGPASVVFAEWDSRPTDRVDRLVAAFSNSAVPATASADIWAELWAKFLFVVPFGGVGAATGAPIGVLRSRPGTRELILAGMREIGEVAVALGIKLPHDAIQAAMDFTDGLPAAATSSLQRDIAAGQPSELESWTGAVVRLGARSGTPTPVSSVLYELLSLHEAQSGGAAGPGPAPGTAG